MAILPFVALCCLAQGSWERYENDRFGYSLLLPPGLTVSNRAADGSGVTWQTGTVRVQVSGFNNRYKLEPKDFFAGMRAVAGGRIVKEKQGRLGGYPWYEILYTKDSRRVHRRAYAGGGAINSVEFSYGYRYREEKEALGERVLETFQPGDLDRTF